MNWFFGYAAKNEHFGSSFSFCCVYYFEEQINGKKEKR